MHEKNLSELVSYNVDDYIKELSKYEHAEDRIEKMLEYTKLQLSHGEIHPLSRFWKMRKYCLDHFKVTIPIAKRLKLWKNYCQLIDEIIKLKQLIDEKSSFEKEQIEGALKSIADDLDQLDVLIANETSINVPKCPAIAQHSEFYTTTQKELSIYSSYAKRLNALKKEILSLDISFKRKQEILDQIHALSDRVFPEKRRLLNLMSSTYASHIDRFVKHFFNQDHFKIPIYQLKEQIKQLQNFAKLISLNVDAFSKTREQLSQCWDQLKAFEKIQKKEKEEKKEHNVQKFDDLKEKIDDLKQDKQKLAPTQLNQEAQSLNASIKKEDLLKFQKKQLLNELHAIVPQETLSSPSSETSPEFEMIKNELYEIEKHITQWDYPTIDSKLKTILSYYKTANLADSSLLRIERAIFTIKEALFKKLKVELEERADIEEVSFQLDAFKAFLKEGIESYRKALSSSNQSIEKAMVFNDLLVQSRGLLNSLEKVIATHQV